MRFALVERGAVRRVALLVVASRWTADRKFEVNSLAVQRGCWVRAARPYGWTLGVAAVGDGAVAVAVVMGPCGLRRLAAFGSFDLAIQSVTVHGLPDAW